MKACGRKLVVISNYSMEEGIVPGGGVSFLRCLAEVGKVEYANDDEKTGLEILRKALEEPLKISGISSL